ncbi:MAG TPA: glycoside hydrolase 43 family protein [Candidatus Limiplasma sp.]|nr:glycoside hydrolase 43 family protein [Candidatus Limiplasma sp.]
MRYQNPILMGDYSDPDVVRVGEDYYMVSSSFTYLPGIPVLHSRDLVHWRLISYAVKSLPFARYNVPVHKCGTWAPSIRHHDGLFYVYVCLPDEGLLACTAADPAGEWRVHYVKDVTGWIDPCPFWDDDGSAYLLHAFAASRVGIKSVLYLHRMSEDGLTILDNGRPVFDGGTENETTEGPKMYKRDGMYYIFAPAGGVTGGWQLAMRAATPYGPYEVRRVLEQGATDINGPHQGGWVDTPFGEDWFIHFQDVGVYGRIPHLQPVHWADGWPVMGRGGEPVWEYTAPRASEITQTEIPTSDEFQDGIHRAWQWQANPQSTWYECSRQGLRLYAAQAPSLFEAGQYLSQLMQKFGFSMQVRLTLHPDTLEDCAGIAVMGYTYHYLALYAGELRLVRGTAEDRGRHVPVRVRETVLAYRPVAGDTVVLQLQIRNGRVRFFYGEAEPAATPIGSEAALSCGGWTGARPGIFAMSKSPSVGSAVFAYCRFGGL